MPSTPAVEGASTFTIRELTGDQREVVLAGRCLPYRPFSLRTEQRLDIEWGGGDPIGTATVMGASEMPSTIGGMWKDKFMGRAPAEDENAVGPAQGNELVAFTFNGAAVENVREAEQIMHWLVKAGQLLEVTWDLTTRHGLLKVFDRSWHNIHDLEWSMDFEWISNGEQQVGAQLAQEVSLSDTASVLGKQTQNVLKEMQPEFPISLDLQSKLNSYGQKLNDLAQQGFAVVGEVARQAKAPADATRNMITLAQSLAQQAEDLINELEAQPYSTLNRASATTPSAPAPTFAERATSAEYSRRVQREARKLRAEASIRRSKMADDMESDLIGQWVARAGENLRDVSRTYYKTPNEWRRLQAFNVLDTSELYAGQIVLVPRLSAGGT